MNGLILLLLLFGNGNCFGNDGNSCCAGEYGRERERDCDRDRDGNRDRDCDCGRGDDRSGRNDRSDRNDRGGCCDGQGARPAMWSDCGCDNDSSRSPRQDFPGFNRGETCGCENADNNQSQN